MSIYTDLSDHLFTSERQEADGQMLEQRLSSKLLHWYLFLFCVNRNNLHKMKDLKINVIALYALRFFVTIFAVSFVLEVGFQLIKGISFSDAYAYWQTLVFNSTKLIVYIVASVAFGIYKSRKEVG